MAELRHLIPSVETLGTATVVCAGDLILDYFIYGRVHRISPEAPIPVIRIESERSMLGGVGNVVRNLGALGCSIRLFAVTGEDSAGREVAALLDSIPRCLAHIHPETERQTPVKTRYVAHSQQLLRADRETTQPVAASIFDLVLKDFAANLADCSVVLLSDYAKGMLSGSHAAGFIRIARDAGKPVVVDPKGSDFRRYSGATLIKPNLRELAEATGMPVGDTKAQVAASRQVLDSTGAEFLLLTRGPDGMLLTTRTGSQEFPALAREVYDVSGAGDTVASTLAAALGSGVPVADAVAISNIAAGIVVGKVGTAVAARMEIVQEIEHWSAIPGNKIVTHAEALERSALWKRMGLRVGLTLGSFDLLSVEDICHISTLRSSCDRLIVAMHGDRFGRNGHPPLRDQKERAMMLGALAAVEAVVIVDNEESLTQFFAALQPEACDSDMASLPK